MKELDKEFTLKDFTFKQLEKIGGVYIYQKIQDCCSRPNFEVIIPLKKQAFELNGYHYEAGEYYPSSSLWGVYGWSYLTLEDAKKKANTENGKLNKLKKTNKK